MQQWNNVTISAVVTQPPAPIGRKQTITPTPVEVWAKAKGIPVLSFPADKEKPWLYENKEDVLNSISSFKPDLLISASYGQMIPSETIQEARHGGLNVHPSLLPRWRGADPVPWTILSGDHQTGVSIVTISDRFDEGNIIAQKKIPVPDDAVSDRLRTTLFTLGADQLTESLTDFLSGKNKGEEQQKEKATCARKLTRSDGFVPWEILQSAMNKSSTIQQYTNETILKELTKQHVSFSSGDTVVTIILRLFRALCPWPGVWTTIPLSFLRKQESSMMKIPDQVRDDRTAKRLKILSAHVENNQLVLDSVQLEGKNPVSWKQFQSAYSISYSKIFPS